MPVCMCNCGSPTLWDIQITVEDAYSRPDISGDTRDFKMPQQTDAKLHDRPREIWTGCGRWGKEESIQFVVVRSDST